jgi:predicted nucleic acid-binding protein
MASYLIDTNILVLAIRRQQARAELFNTLLAAGHSLSCSVITIGEICARMRPHEVQRTEELLAALGAYNVTEQIARQGGSLKNVWAAKGRTLTLADTIIAATAIQYDLILVTENRKDFPMPEIRLYSPVAG